MSSPLSPTAQKVQDALRAQGFAYEVTESAEPARTAAEAVKRVGCDVGQIAKSIVFKTKQSSRPILVVASGANQVNEFRIGMYLKEPIEKAPPAFVRQVTGYTAGGVPPLAHAHTLETFIDQDLMKHAEVWAAGGTPTALFKLQPVDLKTMTNGQVVRVT